MNIFQFVLRNKRYLIKIKITFLNIKINIQSIIKYIKNMKIIYFNSF